jgi:Raf kinase inhibitor-like YbhB/YbcL family protein
MAQNPTSELQVSARVQGALAALAMLALLAAPTHAQQRGGGGGGGGGGGRGRGRGPIVVMTLTSSAFADGARIPEKYAQPGHELSPPLTWSGAPDSTVSFVLIVHDLDAAIGNGIDDMLHWMVWNIPGGTSSLAEGVPALSQLADGTRQISATGPYYRAPAAPASGPPHHYLFELYALDIMLDVPAIGAAPPATRASAIAGMASHVRAKASLVGLYRRGP